MSLDFEMSVDRDHVVFDQARYSNYLLKYNEAVVRRDRLVRSIFVLDGILFILNSGKSITVPGFGIALSELPGAIPILLILSASSFMALTLAFLNEQSYLSIVSQFHIRKCRGTGIDPDFSVASDVFQEMCVKLFRRKFNIWGFDRFEAGQEYVSYFKKLGIAISMVFLGLFSLHFVIAAVSIASFWAQAAYALSGILLALLTVFINGVGLAVLAGLWLTFDFHVRSGEPVSTASPPSPIMPEPVVTSVGGSDAQSG